MDESNIPIDINTTKLLDWLISRRHVSKTWQDNILKIREKINAAIQDMPEHKEILKLLTGQHINYFHCLKIVDILKETEKDSKNVFGRYGSQRMKDWKDIVSCYQKENIYLAEAAQIVIRNVNFEIPSMKKQIQKLEQFQLEYEKKIKDYSKSETVARNEFVNTCKQLGIEGIKIKKELLALLSELPLMYERSATNIKLVLPALEMYNSFIGYHTGQGDTVSSLPMLEYLIKTGNTTTYEFTYGEKPISIEEPPLNIVDDEDNDNSGSNEIDFGDGEIDFGEVKDIDFGSLPAAEGEIDFGSLNMDEGFEIIDHSDINLEESGIVVEKSGHDGGIARDSEAYTILDNPKTRDIIINELMELETFLKMRIYEISTDTDSLTMTQLDAPAVLQMQGLDTMTVMKDSVELALNQLLNKRALHLHNIKHSPKYIDILTASLKQKLNIVERMEANKKILEEKITEVQKERSVLRPVINIILEKTKVLVKEIEEDISKKYKGRKVNITGGISAL